MHSYCRRPLIWKSTMQMHCAREYTHLEQRFVSQEVVLPCAGTAPLHWQ